MPVILATVLAAVAGPIVDALERRGVRRPLGAALMLLAIVLIGVGVFLLVLGGISSQSADISAEASQGLDKIEGGSRTSESTTPQSAKQHAKDAVPQIRHTLVTGVAAGIDGLDLGHVLRRLRDPLARSSSSRTPR